MVEDAGVCHCGTCLNYWTGPSCATCPVGYSGAKCEKCPVNTIRPLCRSCSVATDCSDHAISVMPNSNQLFCTCRCRNNWGGVSCDKCVDPFGGADCDQCAAGRENYPACTVAGVVPDRAAELVKCQTKCTGLKCTGAHLADVNGVPQCTCDTCDEPNRSCSAADPTKKCIYPLATCLTRGISQICVLKNAQGQQAWGPCVMCV